MAARFGSLRASISTVSAVRKPGSNRADAIALRRKMAAQISSSADAKTCTPISTLRARPGRASFTSSPRSVRTGSIRVACSAGISAKNAVASHRRDDQEQRDAPIGSGHAEVDVAEIERHGAQRPVDRAFERDARDHVAAGGRGQREQQAFGQQLADDAAPRRAERQPDADLALPRHAARQQQVGDVGAANQQDQSEREEQRREEREGLQRLRNRAAPGARARCSSSGRSRCGDRLVRVPRRELRAGALHRHTGLQPADDVDADAVFACRGRPAGTRRAATAAPSSPARSTSSPRNPSGITPIISNGAPLTSTVRPSTFGSRLKRRCQPLIAQHDDRRCRRPRSSSAGPSARPMRALHADDLEEVAGDERDGHHPAVDAQIDVGHRRVGVGEDARLRAQRVELRAREAAADRRWPAAAARRRTSRVMSGTVIDAKQERVQDR